MAPVPDRLTDHHSPVSTRLAAGAAGDADSIRTLLVVIQAPDVGRQPAAHKRAPAKRTMRHK